MKKLLLPGFLLLTTVTCWGMEKETPVVTKQSNEVTPITIEILEKEIKELNASLMRELKVFLIDAQKSEDERIEKAEHDPELIKLPRNQIEARCCYPACVILGHFKLEHQKEFDLLREKTTQLEELKKTKSSNQN